MAQTYHKPAANTAAVVTIAAASEVVPEIAWIDASYGGSGTLAGGNLKVESPSGTVVWEVDLAAKGHFSFRFDTRSLKGASAQAAIVTLAAGGSNVQGILTVRTRD